MGLGNPWEGVCFKEVERHFLSVSFLAAATILKTIPFSTLKHSLATPEMQTGITEADFNLKERI